MKKSFKVTAILMEIVNILITITAMIAFEWCFRIEQELIVVIPIFKESILNSCLASMNSLKIPLVQI